MTMPKGWDADKIKRNKEKVAKIYSSGIDPNRSWAEQQQEAWEAKRYAEFTEQEKKRNGHYHGFPEELSNYYYNVVKPAQQNPATSKEAMDSIMKTYGKMLLDHDKKLQEARRLQASLEYAASLKKSNSSRSSSGKAGGDAGFALLIGGIITVSAMFLVGLIWLQHWYLMIPGFIGLFLMFALTGSGGGGGHSGGYEAAHYWRSSRGRNFRMWAAGRRS